MVTEVAKRLINVDEYYKMAEVGILKPGDRVELIHGEIYEMSPVGSKHASVVKRLARVLNELFSSQAVIGIQDPVRLDLQNEPEPDISILRHRSDDYASKHPEPNDVLAIIEVSDSTINYDREVKKPLYASCGIPVYWIIDVKNGLIEVYLNPDGSTYSEQHIYASGDRIPLLDKAINAEAILS